MIVGVQPTALFHNSSIHTNDIRRPRFHNIASATRVISINDPSPCALLAIQDPYEPVLELLSVRLSPIGFPKNFIHVYGWHIQYLGEFSRQSRLYDV
jgi:hypothetical protein